ncbi:MAG: DUF4838 domain-containing protein [Armatimonadia bacterium]
MYRLLIPIALLLCLTAQAAPNIYPDPSFEASGIAGTARTGQKAMYLKSDGQSRWAAVGGAIDVEPFARYRVTEWVKGSPGKAQFSAPYCYEWDSYEWAWAVSKPLKASDDWVQTELTFISPRKTMYVYPLAYMNAEKGEAWADDIVVEKIAEPEQVMAEIMARPNPSDGDRKLIGWWLVHKGDLAGAEKIMLASTGLTRADLATILAQATTDPVRRIPYLVQMVAYGGPTYHEGLKRFNELAADLTPQHRFGIAVEALKLNGTDERAQRAVTMLADTQTLTDPLESVSEKLAKQRANRDLLAAAMATTPAGSPAAAKLQTVLTQMDQTLAALEAQASSLGKCQIKLGGQLLRPDTAAIVLADKPTPQESYAARDLRHHLELITGHVFPIVSESAFKGKQGLYIGNTRRAAATMKVADLGLEGLYLKSVGPSLILAGNQRGCLYATYTFLEDYLGCRWFTPDCATWPTSGTITVPALSRKYFPPLEFRAGDYPIARSGEFAVRLRLNGNNHQMSKEQGGRKGVHSLAHTFGSLVPPEKYFAEHPEYFSLVGGKRQSGYAQICLTNPEVLKLCIQGVRNWIKQNPDMKVFSVSQNDTHYPCECDNCKAVVEAEGSQAGPVVRFVNAIADDIKADYPDVAIETLAYQYTRKPPKLTKPRPNVIVCLCSIECCFIHPLGTDEFNKTFADDIRGWNKICDRLWIWDYIINYAHSICPFPNLYTLKPNTQFFLDNGVKGIYEESCYYTKGSELQELRNYVMAKLLWDPKYDTDKAIDEFCAAFYGPAAKPVREYINLIHQSVQVPPKLHVQIYTHPKQYVFPEVIAASEKLFDQAEAAVANDPVYLHRVQVARLPIMYAQITLASSGTFVEKNGKLVQEEGNDVSALVDRFAAIARQEGVTKVREGGGNADLEGWLSSVPRQPRSLRIEQIASPTLRVQVLPELGGRIFRMTYLPTNRELFRVGGEGGKLMPAEGGYEEYSQGSYRTPGWSEGYTIAQVDSRSVTLQSNLRNGLQLSRKLELDPEKPILHITSTLTNMIKEPVTASLRSHPEFAVTSTEQANVRILGPDGKWRTIALANPADPKAERDQWLRDAEMPQGAWAVVDEAAGLAVLNRFDQAAVACALLNRAGQQSRVNLELFGKELSLKPGESLTLKQSLEVTQPDKL